jgi:hypothetical protein
MEPTCEPRFFSVVMMVDLDERGGCWAPAAGAVHVN